MVSFVDPRVEEAQRGLPCKMNDRLDLTGQPTTPPQTAPSRLDSGHHVQDMNAESFGIPTRSKPWQWCVMKGS